MGQHGRLLLLLGAVALGGCNPSPSAPTGQPASPAVISRPPSRPASTASPPRPATSASAAGAQAAARPVAAGPWKRMHPARPSNLRYAIWDAKSSRLLAIDGDRLFAWTGAGWALQPDKLHESRNARLLAHPEGAKLVQLIGTTVTIDPVGAAPPAKPVALPARLHHQSVLPAWHAGERAIVLHFLVHGEHGETWLLRDGKVIGRIKSAPHLVALGSVGETVVGFDVHRTQHRLEGRVWKASKPDLPSGEIVLGNGDGLMINASSIHLQTKAGWRAIPAPADVTGRVGRDLGRDQIVLRQPTHLGDNRDWVSTAGGPFVPVQPDTWWAPVGISSALLTFPDGVRQVHGPTGAVRRLTPTGWTVEIEGGLRVDPTWAPMFQYGTWDSSALRFDLDESLWRSGPWRRVKSNAAEGPSAYQRERCVSLAGAEKRLVAARDDGETWILEGAVWRLLSGPENARERGTVVSTPKGFHLGARSTLSRLVDQRWQPVVRAEGVEIDRIAFDARREVLWLIGRRDGGPLFGVIDAKGFRALGELPAGVETDQVDFAVDAPLGVAALMNAAGDLWLRDLEQFPVKGGLP